MEKDDIDLGMIPIIALKPSTKKKLSCMLSTLKVLSSPEGLPRDYRGLAQLMELKTLSIGFAGVDAVIKILHIWSKECESATLGKFQLFLKLIDRYDVLDDTAALIQHDALEYIKLNTKKNYLDRTNDMPYESVEHITIDDVLRAEAGLGPQKYDAFLLFVDNDSKFARELVDKMENEYSLKLCVKDRDLIGGVSLEHEAILKLISNRCHRLIVIISEDFLRSNAHKFFLNFGQALGIEQKRRKVIPCKYKSCTLPPELTSYYLLDYDRLNILGIDFWFKLSSSISPQFTNLKKSFSMMDGMKNKCILPTPGLVQCPSQSHLKQHSATRQQDHSTAERKEPTNTKFNTQKKKKFPNLKKMFNKKAPKKQVEKPLIV